VLLTDCGKIKKEENVNQQDQTKVSRPLIRLLNELVDQMLASQAKVDFKTKCLINMGKPIVPRLLQKLGDEPETVDKIKVMIRQALEADDEWLKRQENTIKADVNKENAAGQ
jgi:hypothetical protein